MLKLDIDKKYLVNYTLISVLIASFYILFGHELSKLLEGLIIFKTDVSKSLILMVVYFLLFVLVTFIYNKYSGQVASIVVTEKASQLLDSIDVNSKRESESILNALFVHLEKYRPYQMSFIPTVVLTTTKVVAIIAVLFFIEPIAAIILLTTAPFIPLFYILVGLKTEDEALTQATEFDEMGTLFLNLVRGKDTVKFTNAEKEANDTLETSNENFLATTMHILKYAFQSTLMLEFITILGIGLTALEVGLRIIIFENITFYQSFFVLLMAPEFYASLKVMGTEFHNGKLADGHLEKFNESIKPKAREYRIFGDKLQLKNITLKTDRELLKNVTLNFNDTGLIAITGKSGVGKTTLLNSIGGLKPVESGEIIIPHDDFGYISDDLYLSDVTFKEYFENVDDESIIKELKDLNLYTSIMSLDDGLNTLIVNNNVPLSGGEIVRLKLARVLLLKPKIILMDEPTEFLDEETETVVLEHLKELKKTHLIITVVHKEKLLNIADTHIKMTNETLEVSA